MLAFLLVVGLAATAPLAWGMLGLIRGRGVRAGGLRRALGWIGLCTAPAPFVQMARWSWVQPHGYSVDGAEAAAGLPFAWMVLTGGRSVIAAFEANVEGWTGHRQSTMLDNWPVFLALVVVQTAILAAVLGWRLRGGHAPWRDPVALILGAALLVNALAAVDWVWGGS